MEEEREGKHITHHPLIWIENSIEGASEQTNHSLHFNQPTKEIEFNIISVFS